MRQMINSMATKMEIGSPMASMYVLGNPDHYKSHTYVNFAWRPFAIFVKRFWEDLSGHSVTYSSLTLFEWVQSAEKKARTRAGKQEFEKHSFIEKDVSSQEDNSEDEHSEDGSVAWNMEDADGDIVKKMAKKAKRYRATQHDFLPIHTAAFKTHTVHCDFRKFDDVIPNFLGGALPRSDKGDREFYCMTMIMLFKSWRSPTDLKDQPSTWDQTFVEHDFTQRQRELIANFNLRYECNDARDDHYAIMRQK
ncbi:hypothetical protein K438DRAFT_1510921, partial [Mycena galopus ATCC 62051]